MKKIFRKIRQDLLSKGKTGKYLKYAIGEIVLVVIGILIALSINSWNENRIDSIKEKQILESFEIDLQSNKIELERVIRKTDNTHNVSDSILNYQNTFIKELSLAQLDTLILDAAGYTVYKTHEGTIQDVLGSGELNIIKNDTIRLSMASWQANLKSIREWEKNDKELSEQYYYYLKQKVSIYNLRNKEGILTENKKNELFSDNLFLNNVYTKLGSTKYLNTQYKKELTKNDKLLSIIEKELDQK